MGYNSTHSDPELKKVEREEFGLLTGHVEESSVQLEEIDKWQINKMCVYINNISMKTDLRN